MGKYSSLVKESGAAADKMKFRFISGKYSGGEFFIRDGQKLSIGRDISSDVAIVDSKVSRNHATIISRAGRIFIEDHNSTNGTFVNGEKILPSSPVEIHNGFKISIGDSVIAVGEGDADNNEKVERSVKEDTPSGQIGVSSTQNTGKVMPPLDEYDEDEPLTLDAIAEKAEKVENNKISVAKVALKKGGPATTSKTVPDSAVASSKGSLSAIDPVDLLKLLSQSSSSGYLIVNISSPFEEKIEIAIGRAGIVASECISSRNFSQEKALSRFILAKDGEYEFKVDEAPKREEINRFLEDVFMEISTQKGLLARYRKIINADQLRFMIPITGKLSDLSKPELETLQFMVNTREVLPYLNMFPDNDDFILLSEILKFIDLGILFGDNNEEDHIENLVPDDILQI
ncbi:MAG TPA: FHA domain-containing protein [bacterium]|nr:FHA domain-containing protein [bacterium]HQN72409.1 FHA domain-containing protein [bacterium]HQO92128.1 FHA domain-containing protein [bacterium]